MDSFYTASDVTAERVPLSPIEVENPEDYYAKQIQKVLPSWNISTVELQKYNRREYYPLVTFRNTTPEKLLELLSLLQKTWEYLTPQEERGNIPQHLSEDMVSIFKDMQGKLERRKGQYDLYPGDRKRQDYAISGCQQWLCYTVRKVLTPQFLSRLLRRSRELLAKNGELALDTTLELASEPAAEPAQEPTPVAAAEPTPEQTTEKAPEPTAEPTGNETLEVASEITLDQALNETPVPAADETPSATADETPEAALARTLEHLEIAEETYSPFSSHQEASDSLIRCIHLILAEHFCIAYDYDYPSDPTSKDAFSATGQAGSPSHWSQLYQYLQKDIEQNGPAPQKLQSFFESVRFGCKLERITPADANVLFAIRKRNLKSALTVIAQARSDYEVDYEMW